jgi:flagellar biosynthetic protein FliP
MGAAMYLPFALLLVPYWAGSLSSGMLMVGGHVLMLAGMAAAMWRRRDEYLHGHTR